MYVNYIADKGVKLLGGETGAWLADSINNDFILIKNQVNDWTINTQGFGGVVNIDKHTISITQGTQSKSIGVYTSIPTVIGKVYSVAAKLISGNGINAFQQIGVDKVIKGNLAGFSLATKDCEVGVNIVSFTAITTLTYIYLSNRYSTQTPAVIWHNYVEIREAESLGGQDSVELNTLNNAVSDNNSEADSTNGFVSFSLDGTGLNVFKTVSNLLYPERHTYANAASDPSGNEADSITGFTSINNATVASLISAPAPNVGTFGIRIESNSIPTNQAGCFMDLNDNVFDLQNGRRYVLSIDARHFGTNGDYSIYLSDTNTGSTIQKLLVTLSNTDVVYNSYSLAWNHDTNHRYLVFRENSGSNDGGIYLDNLSIKESNEYHTYSNAASDSSRESDSIAGWSAGFGAIVSSVSTPIDTGLFAISIESNTTPTDKAKGFLTLTDSVINLIAGKQYRVKFQARHIGTGNTWNINMAGTSTTFTIVTLETADTTYIEYTHEFIHDPIESTWFQCIENNVTNDGGVYIDNLSITEVQVNTGNYAIHAESNDTPTQLAGCYVDMEAAFSLTQDKLYSLTIDAKHVGVGDGWRINLSADADPDVGPSLDVVRDLINVEYNAYSKTWKYNGEKYLVISEDNGANDGGVYFDNLRVHVAGELHTYSNAAADPAGLEDNDTDGFSVGDNAVLTSVASPVDTGVYAISIESNTTPTVDSRGYVDLQDNVINLALGETYILSFSMRHNGIGDAWDIGLGSSASDTTEQLIKGGLLNTDITFISYSATFIASTANRFLVFIEGNGANDGGVYVDNLSIRKALPDASATGLGLAIFGDIQKHVVNFNADAVSYGNFSINNYLVQPYNPALDYGTGDFFWSFFVKVTPAGTQTIFQRNTTPATLLVGFYVDANGIGNFQTQYGSILTSNPINDNIVRYIVLQRVSGELQLIIDTVIDGTLNVSATFTALQARLYIGISAALGGAATESNLALFKTGNFSLTQTQIRNIYDSEKILFQKDSAYSEVDAQIDLDIVTQSVTRSTEFNRNQNVSLGGNTETLFNRQDNFWNTRTTLIDDLNIKYHRQFFDSVINGQTFTFDPYGITAAPVDPKQVIFENNKYTEGRQGQLDKFRVDFKVKE